MASVPFIYLSAFTVRRTSNRYPRVPGFRRWWQRLVICHSGIVVRFSTARTYLAKDSAAISCARPRFFAHHITPFLDADIPEG